jgi:NADH-quinone oxidoreductase subunit N
MRTFANLLAFSPELWLLLGAVVVFGLSRTATARLTTMVALISLLLAFAALATQFKQTITILDGAFLLDGFAVVTDVVLLATAALVLLASRADVLPGELERPSVAGFLLLATLAAMLAVSAAEMVSLIVSLELLAVSFYVLTALLRRGPGAMAVSLGYAVAGAATTGLLVYGLALLFGLSGQTQLGAAGSALSRVKPNQAAVMLMLSLLIGGFSVRIGLLPIRWWVRGFEAGVSLRGLLLIQSLGVVAALAVFARLVTTTLSGTRIPYAPLLAVVAAVVMTAGTLIAITQNSLRRMLAYSAIGQGGFALAAFTDLRRVGLTALLIFLVATALTSVAAFTAVIAYARSVHSDAIRDLAGMSSPSPALALALSLALLSLAGAPPLAGFFGKLLVLQATVDGGYAWLAVIGIVNIVLGILGYLRVVRIALIDPPVFEVIPARLDAGLRAGLGLACAGVVFMGLLLGPLSSAATYARGALIH